MARTAQNSSHKAIEKYVSNVRLQGGVLTYYPVVINNSLTVTGNETLTGNLTVTGTVNNLESYVSITGSTAAPTQAQSGSTFALNRATGSTITLPAPVVGTTYTFVVSTAVTSTSYKIITSAGTVLLQGAYVAGYATVTDVNVFNSVVATSNISFNMNGSTTGGLVGTQITFTCLSSTLWQVSGINMGSGTMTTSFATS